jgi:uncharacterized membrane protein YeaQ/YmgE (transglycosylase-associated protein family)
MDWVGTIVGALVAGIIIGPLARLVLPGSQNISLGMTILIGAVGALIGGLVADWLNIGSETGETAGIDWIKHAIQVAVAAVLVILYGSMAGRRAAPSGGTTPPPPAT